MNRKALEFETRNLGKRLPNTERPAFDQLPDLKQPVLVIVGTQDTPYILAAADYMHEKLPSAQKAIIEDAAHLPNMEHPSQFQTLVKEFLESHVS
jgi:pimeloyl-ACP methyl ester carboxylesterase